MLVAGGTILNIPKIQLNETALITVAVFALAIGLLFHAHRGKFTKVIEILFFLMAAAFTVGAAGNFHALGNAVFHTIAKLG